MTRNEKINMFGDSQIARVNNRGQLARSHGLRNQPQESPDESHEFGTQIRGIVVEMNESSEFDICPETDHKLNVNHLNCSGKNSRKFGSINDDQI